MWYRSWGQVTGAGYLTWGVDEGEVRKSKLYDRMSWVALALLILGMGFRSPATGCKQRRVSRARVNGHGKRNIFRDARRRERSDRSRASREARKRSHHRDIFSLGPLCGNSPRGGRVDGPREFGVVADLKLAGSIERSNAWASNLH